MKFNTIYSLGSRCQNSEVLKHYGYREFAGFFDFMYVEKIYQTNHILADDFNEILKDENIVTHQFNKLTIEPETGIQLPTSVRTSNKFYNIPVNIDTAIFPHHDLKSEKDKNHFIKCISRFKSLVNYNILFNYTFNTWENNISVYDMELMVKTLREIHGFKNFKLCFIGVVMGNESNVKKIFESEYYDVWQLTIRHGSFTGGLFSVPIDNENYIGIIKNYDIEDKRITKEEIDN